jgi:hypothetical protein
VPYFYRRSLELRSGARSYIVYAVFPTEGKPDPVPVVGGFPAGWRPTENPGQCLADDRATVGYFITTVPRSQFRHYERITERDALELYPDLVR